MNINDLTDEEFDLYIRGAWDERNRIIALLKSKDEWNYAFSDVSDVIALIEGATK